MKKRNPRSVVERLGVNALEAACLKLNLIWRDLFQEDVGVDGTIELVLTEAPTGKIVAVQVKAGASYLRSEDETSFRFYPSPDDLEYWRKLAVPLILVIFDPNAEALYWIDVNRQVEDRQGHWDDQPYLLFQKSSKIDPSFEQYIASYYDLRISSPDEMERVYQTLKELSFQTTADGKTVITVSGLDVFLQGLWGLCSKTCFHFSIFTDLIRQGLSDGGIAAAITFNLSRPNLHPFLSEYFRLLGEGHLARLDYEDISYSMYVKMEWPTYIVSLTTNGLAFVKYCREKLAGDREVRDGQLVNLRLFPHIRIQIFSSYVHGEEQPFGSLTDYLFIRFNRILDYYTLTHLKYDESGCPALAAEQSVFYFELQAYIQTLMEGRDLNCLLATHLDAAVTPMSCWLERFVDSETSMDASWFDQPAVSHSQALHEELLSTFSVFAATTVQENPVLDPRALFSANGQPFFPQADPA